MTTEKEPQFLILNGKIPTTFSVDNFHKEKYGKTIFQDTLWTQLDKKSPQDIGGYRIYSQEDVLNILAKRSQSKTLQKNIENAKEGKLIEMYTTSSTAHLIAYRLTTDDLKFLNEMDEVNKKLENVNKEIQKLIPETLLEERKELEKQKRKFKK